MICNICDSETSLAIEKVEGYIKEDFYNIYVCIECKSSIPSPQKSSDLVYENIYRNAENIEGYSRYFIYAKEVLSSLKPLVFLSKQEAVYYSIYETIKTINKENSKILEIGSGLGYTTFAINKSGYDCVGIDISKEAIEKARHAFGDNYRNISLFELKEEVRYDLVIMTELLEHVVNPKDFISKCREILKKDGKILITTPNKNFYPTKTIWLGDLPPVHLWFYTEQALKNIASQLNLKISFLDFTKFNKTFGTFLDKDQSLEENLRFLLHHNSSKLDINGNLIRVANNSQKTNLKIKKIISILFGENIGNFLILRLKIFKNRNRTQYFGSKNETMACILENYD